MTMISPNHYCRKYENAAYVQLIEERDKLLSFIKDYEVKELSGDRSGELWNSSPRADVHYQMSLLCLSELCKLMEEKYNQDYVWGPRCPGEEISFPKPLTR